MEVNNIMETLKINNGFFKNGYYAGVVVITDVVITENQGDKLQKVHTIYSRYDQGGY